MSQNVALLRGINVGGHRRLPMAELRELCASLGWTQVKTYIASGNVWFEANQPRADALASAIADKYGYDVPVILRTLGQLAAALAASPYSEQAAADPKSVHVVFLSAVPDADKVAALDPDRSPGDRFEVVGAEVHVHFAGASHSSKISLDWLERGLGVRASGRNWRTVERLADGP